MVGWLKASKDIHRPNNTPSPRHIGLHILHLFSGLEREATAIKGNAFANKRNAHFFALGSAAITQDDEFRGRCTALCHRKQSTHAQFLHARSIQYFTFQPKLPGHSASTISQFRWEIGRASCRERV